MLHAVLILYNFSHEGIPKKSSRNPCRYNVTETSFNFRYETDLSRKARREKSVREARGRNTQMKFVPMRHSKSQNHPTRRAHTAGMCTADPTVQSRAPSSTTTTSRTLRHTNSSRYVHWGASWSSGESDGMWNGLQVQVPKGRDFSL